MIVLLNKNANNGRGLTKWKHARAELEKRYLGPDYRVVSETTDLDRCLAERNNGDERVFVAAGGDGTVNFLLNRIMNIKSEKAGQLTLGAIGLGSSNDFHKPFARERMVHPNVSFRLDYTHALRHNVGQVDFEDNTGRRQRKFFIINCSLGIIALANYRFNTGGGIIRWLKPRWVLGTIWCVALKTLLVAPNIPIRMTVDGKSLKTEMTCLSVLINPHFSGNLCYDLPVSGQSPYFGVALCERMGIRERTRTILSLSLSKFSGLPKTKSWRADHLEIDTAFPMPLELDGEVYLARKIEIKLQREALRVCQ